MKGTVTTLIPTYRRPKLLKRAIKSVLNQTYNNVVIKVFDNYSKDNTKNVVDNFDDSLKKIIYFQNEKNIGAIRNFHQAFNHVDTDYFSLLSDDDVLLPNFYEIAVGELEKNPNAMFVVGKMFVVKDDLHLLEIVGLSLKAGIHHPPDGFREFFYKGPSTWTCILFRSEIVKLIGKTDVTLGPVGDLEYIYRVASQFPYLAIDHYAAIFTVHNNQFSGKNDYLLSNITGRFRFYHAILKDFNLPTQDSEEFYNILVKRYCKRLIRRCRHWIKNDDSEQLEHACKVLRQYGGVKEHYIAFFIRTQPRLVKILFDNIEKIKRCLVKPKEHDLKSDIVLEERFIQAISYIKSISTDV